MGYTHYWSFKEVDRGEQSKVEALYQKAVDDCKTIIKRYQSQYEKGSIERLSGTTPHAPQYMGIDFNGSGSAAHEQFSLRAHYRENGSFNFCKTAYKPYDKVVVACLCALSHRLGEYVEVSSDGEAADWIPGLLLATQATRLRIRMPETVQDRDSEQTNNVIAIK